MNQVWVVGLVERNTNRLLLFPVVDRSADTLENIVTKHVAPGSRVFTDGWVGYKRLNELGFQHFSVLHRDTFRQTYEKVDDSLKTTVTCHTNQIGAWSHTHQHFQRISGNQTNHFEGHL
jgi:transposase-like protein